jgi:citrate synthase
MAALRTGFSAVGNFEKGLEPLNLERWTETGIKQIAQMATVAGAWARICKGLEPVEPDPKLDHATNFLYMMTGKKPPPEEAKVMDVSLILHLDHEMNASTFTTMVIASSLPDMYSAVVGGIGSLKGPLHGGANEQVLRLLLDIGEPAKAEAYVQDLMARKIKIMGFGHRVYKAYDPRARILRRYAEQMSAEKGIGKLFAIADIVEKTVIAKLGARGIFPNVDFYSGIVYHAMGIEVDMFTPIFAVSRVAGWVARDLEYVADNRIFRPRSLYTGSLKEEYVPIDKR